MSQGLRQFAQDAKGFMLAAGVRAVKTMAQTALALIGTNAVGVTEIDWAGVASGAALSGIISVLTSVTTGLPEVGPSETPKEG